MKNFTKYATMLAITASLALTSAPSFAADQPAPETGCTTITMEDGTTATACVDTTNLETMPTVTSSGTDATDIAGEDTAGPLVCQDVTVEDCARMTVMPIAVGTNANDVIRHPAGLKHKDDHNPISDIITAASLISIGALGTALYLRRNKNGEGELDK
jgi:hypothetical protein